MSNKKTGNYDEYVSLLNKYKTRHPMEKWSKESYTEESKRNRINDYIRLSESIMDDMKLTGSQRRDLKHLLRTVPLKPLHHNAKIEVIIISLCIYVRKTYNNRNFRWKEYGVVKKHDVTCTDVLTVMTNLCIYYARKVPLPYTDGVDKYGNINYEDYEENI